MAALTPAELAGAEMYPTWEKLEAVQARDAALIRFIDEELLPEERTADAAGFSARLQLCLVFNEIWRHYVPTNWELILADREGRLAEKIAELNTRFREGK
jgi:hypothetical protein